VRDLTEPVVAIIGDETRKLTDLPGIGKDLAEKIVTLCQTGTLPMHQELLSQIPVSVLTLMRVPGVGPKKAATLHRDLGISTLEELREACTSNRVQKLKGFGVKTEQTILAGLEHADS